MNLLNSQSLKITQRQKYTLPTLTVHGKRGSNERHNGLLRRFIPKGKRIGKYTSDDILLTADWCNLLPRKILGYKSPDDLFENELDKIYVA